MKFVIATENPGKLREFRDILEPLGFTVVGLEELGLSPQQEETGETFAENARIKAMDIFQQSGLPTIADDSGLCVDALNGRPGVYSARYGGVALPQEEKNKKLLAELQAVPKEKRTAHFACHIVCVLDLGHLLEAKGTVEGWIGFSPMGEGGFGYDPLFMVGTESYGQICPEEKNKHSHRGKAMNELQQQLRQLFSQ